MYQGAEVSRQGGLPTTMSAVHPSQAPRSLLPVCHPDAVCEGSPKSEVPSKEVLDSNPQKL